MPAQDVNDVGVVQEIAPQPSGLFPDIRGLEFFRPDQHHGAIGGKDKYRAALLVFGDVLDAGQDFFTGGGDLGKLDLVGQIVGEGMDGVGGNAEIVD